MVTFCLYPIMVKDAGWYSESDPEEYDFHDSDHNKD